MSFMDIAYKRYSVRRYKNSPVEKEKIIRVLEAGRIAPSAVNFQPYQFIVLTEQSIRDKVVEAYPRDWFMNAPVIIVVCGDHSKSWKRKDGKDHCDIDAAIAADHMTLAATDLGLGTCWVCAFDAEKCRRTLNLPDYLEPIILIPMGYPEDDNWNPEKKRKSLADLVSWEAYDNRDS